MHATDEQAIQAARRANEASGALPARRAIESRHKRIRGPGSPQVVNLPCLLAIALHR
jgi:hypothetical protein